MSENLFRVGGVYFDGRGEPCFVADMGPRYMLVASLNRPEEGTLSHLLDGRFFATAGDPDSKYHLLPGELTQVDGQWVRRLDLSVVNVIHAIPTLQELQEEGDDWMADMLMPVSPDEANAAMIARDGPAKPAAAKPVAVPTALPANAALTRLHAGSHLFGSVRY